VILEYDTEADATYITLTDEPVVQTHSVGDLIMVDLDATGHPVGLEILVQPQQLSWDMKNALFKQFPELKELLASVIPY
jgi:uncharacterized protein YuzE